MRRTRATTAIAVALLMLTACAPQSPSASGADDASARSDRLPGAPAPTAVAEHAGVTVTATSTTWRIELLDAGPADLADLQMFDSEASTEPAEDGEQIGWVCVRATQIAGDAGAWMSDDLRIEVWDGPSGPRYDDMTGFDYEPADRSLDVYETAGNALGEPYDRVCPIFVVPEDVDFTTIVVVPDGGEPAVLER